MRDIYGPPNVVAGLVAFYRARDVNARTRIPVERVAGMVRISRIGGFPENPFQDQPRMLVEVWERDQEASFNAAKELWGMVAGIEDQDALPGLVTHKIMPATMPVQMEDDYAPDLDRHQFEIDAFVAMEPMTIT